MRSVIFALMFCATLLFSGAAISDHLPGGQLKLFCSTEQAADQYVDLIVAGLGPTAVKMVQEDPDFKCHYYPRSIGPVDPVKIFREYIGPHTGRELCMLELEFRDAAKTKVWAPFYMPTCTDVLHLKGA
jgi:hypothetical protein